mmetsp:Transcript_65894/g.106266  ORF Transcript_65894/g.106266 Transcript_65894/m.106266 type:complete len:493 (+) Transcript_65894:1308-2786(+)
MQVDRVERQLAQQPDGHHDHPGDPEEQNVMPGLQQRRGEKGIEVLVLAVGPPHSRERPETRREPGVQHVFIPLHHHAAFQAKRGLSLCHGLLWISCHKPHLLGLHRLDDFVGGNAVTPPELTRDAPVLDVLQPVVPGLVVELWLNLELARPHSLDTLVGQLLAVHPPLRLQVRLDDVLRARAQTKAHGMRLLGNPQALLGQGRLDGLTSLEAVLAGKLTTQGVDLAVLVEDADHLQFVTLATLVIVGVVRRGDLHAARAEIFVDHGVGDHYHLPVREERVLQLLADKSLVALIFRVNAHGDISEHGLQTGGGDDQAVRLRSLHEILELTHDAHLSLSAVAGDLQQSPSWNVLVVHFQVRQCRSEVPAPIYQAIIPVNQALVVEADEGLLNSSAEHRVHGEALPRPVHADSDSLHLRCDPTAVLLLPGPHPLQELLSSEVMAGEPFILVQEALHHALRGNARVISTWNPEGYVAAHPIPATEGVLNGAGERVA